ncbi:VWA domain-containing protein, partial [bacterium]
IYLKDVWRLAAVGQGFAGGLDALLAHFGGQQAEEAAPAAAPIAPPAPAAPPVNLKKIELEKKMERQAPQLVSLAKKAQVSLDKVGLTQHTARVALCLDISASMSGLYRSGKIQRFAEKVLALGTRFDDDGAIDVFLFGSGAHEAGSMGIENFQDFVPQMQRQYPLEGGTMYGRAMQLIRRHYFPDGMVQARSAPRRDKSPVYVMFLTDGQTADPPVTKQQVQWSSYEPIFWQFMGLGKSRKDVKKGGGGFWASALASDFSFLEELDNMTGRHCDNANFFSVADPDVLADDELYDLMMSEYPGWVKSAPANGLL